MIEQEIEIIISLGANTPDAEMQLDSARKKIATFGEIVSLSGAYPTAPEYAGESMPYLNEVIVLRTATPLAEVQRLSKEYEKEIRDKNRWKGLVNIDIDIVICDKEVLRQRDFCASYFRAGLRRIGVNVEELQPHNAIVE